MSKTGILMGAWHACTTSFSYLSDYDYLVVTVKDGINWEVLQTTNFYLIYCIIIIIIIYYYYWHGDFSF